MALKKEERKYREIFENSRPEYLRLILSYPAIHEMNADAHRYWGTTGVT